MGDGNDPVQPGNPGQPSTPPPATQPPEGFVEQARFSGAIRKIEELTTKVRDLEKQLETRTSEQEQLKSQLATKDIEQTVAVGERDKALEKALKEGLEKDRELAGLRAYKMKVEMAKTLGHPELIDILQNIPDMQTEEALKVVMTDFVKFREEGVKEREKVLMAGFTPPAGPFQPAPVLPTTNDGWMKLINSLPLGSEDRAKVMDQWHDWIWAQQAK